MSKNRTRIERSDIEQLWSETRAQAPQSSNLRLGESAFQRYTRRGFNKNNLLEIFHENTKRDVFVNTFTEASTARFVDNHRYEYLQTRTPDYPGSELLELPEPEELRKEFSEILRRRRSRRNMSNEMVSIQTISTLLYHACGTTGHDDIYVELPSGDHPELSLKAYPSAGGLYPVKPYIITTKNCELDEGIYFYKSEKHGLRTVRKIDDIETKLSGIFQGFCPSDAAFAMVLTGQFWRSMVKYGERAYRLVLEEAGHIAQNVQLTSEALDMASLPQANFFDRPLDDLLEVDGVNESVIYVVSVGHKGGSYE